MTDRVNAVFIHTKSGELTDRHITSLSLIRYIDVVSRVTKNSALLVLEHEIRVDDFEVIEDALRAFGFKIKYKIINGLSSWSKCAALVRNEETRLIVDHAAKEPVFEGYPDAQKIEQHAVDMRAWSLVMKKLAEIDFTKD